MKKQLIIILILALVSCKKYSDRWLIGEINIVDEITGTPVPAKLELDYYKGSLMGSEKALTELGETDENGFFKLKTRVNPRDSEFKLNVYVTKGYYGSPQQFYPDAVCELGTRKDNKLTINLPRIYFLRLRLNNTSCYDETDTVWIKSSEISYYNFFYTGCLVNYQPKNSSWNDLFYYGNEKTIEVKSISKKNGVLDTLLHNYSLEQGPNTFDLNY